MFKSAALEALEVAIFVVTLGLASSAWKEAIVGTGVALLLTLSVVVILHGYLIKVPDVLLKLSAGILLLSFGTFWLSEGLGFNWFIEDWALLLLVGVYSLLAALVIRRLQTKYPPASAFTAPAEGKCLISTADANTFRLITPPNSISLNAQN